MRDCALSWPLEFQVIAAKRKRANLDTMRVIAYANDRVLGLLDHPDHRGHAAAVAGTHAVNLIHDYHSFLGEARHLALAGSPREVQSSIVSNTLSHLLDHLLAASVRGIVLENLVASVKLSHKTRSRRLANARRATNQRSPGVDVLRHAPARLEAHFLRLSLEDHVVPVPKPLRQLPDDAGVADQLIEAVRSIGINPVGHLLAFPICGRAHRRSGSAGAASGGHHHRLCEAWSCCTRGRKPRQKLLLCKDLRCFLSLRLQLHDPPILGSLFNCASIVKVRAYYQVRCISRNGTHDFGTSNLCLLLGILACHAVHLASEAHLETFQRKATARLSNIIHLRRASCSLGSRDWQRTARSSSLRRGQRSLECRCPSLRRWRSLWAFGGSPHMGLRRLRAAAASTILGRQVDANCRATGYTKALGCRSCRAACRLAFCRPCEEL
mmetsp:Transcript_22439/g.40030  ORF Transcript_22439/g.40030 Transcript_22439/m.40030 type:complete len:439 (+) Transcript_22439:1354-2670(+)